MEYVAVSVDIDKFLAGDMRGLVFVTMEFYLPCHLLYFKKAQAMMNRDVTILTDHSKESHCIVFERPHSRIQLFHQVADDEEELAWTQYGALRNSLGDRHWVRWFAITTTTINSTNEPINDCDL